MGWRRKRGAVAFVPPGQYAVTPAAANKYDEDVDYAPVVVTTEDVLPTYTQQQVAEHNTKDHGILIVVGTFVYDVTQFLEGEHPGGPDVILAFAGKQCDWQFELFHRKEHLTAFHNKLLVGKTDTYIPNPFPRPPSELKASWRVE